MVPAEVDLRDFGFMPLEVLRLRDSDLAALASGDEFKAAVLLWCVAWHQVPAASLPDDDRLLAKHSQALSGWRKVKTEALRGFVKCSDGRLYHPVIAAKAVEAWASKQAQRARTRAATEAREAKRREQQATRDAVRDVDRDEQRDVRRDVHQGTGIGIGTVKGQGEEIPPPPTIPAQAPAAAVGSDAITEGHAPTPAGAVCRALKRAGIADVNPGHPRLTALLVAGAVEAEFVGFVPAAQAKGAGFLWILGAVEGERKRAAQGAGQLHQGEMPKRENGRPEPTNGAPDADQTARYLAERAALTQSPDAVQAGITALKALREGRSAA